MSTMRRTPSSQEGGTANLPARRPTRHYDMSLEPIRRMVTVERALVLRKFQSLSPQHQLQYLRAEHHLAKAVPHALRASS